MKRTSSILLFCALFLLQAQANVVTGIAQVPDGYYNAVDGKKGADNILNALQTCISANYNEISYKGLEPHYLKTDFYADTLWDMYSTCRFVYEDANKPQSKVCDGWNKEHVCCQSWLGSGPMVSDMFNVYPTDARINNLRSNYPYGVVGTSTGISGDPQNHALGKLGTSAKTGYSGKCYEPDDRYKGDFARTFFYMVARYRSDILNKSDGANMFTSSPTNLTAYSLSFLLDWHRNDPVSEKEVDRNEAVYGEQNNRNPFIDYPDLVEYIWGDKVGQTVNLSSLTPTCENVTTVKKYGVTWKVNGSVVRVDSVRENSKPATLPDTPVSCSQTSETFYCWCGAEWQGTLPDYVPYDATTVFTLADMPPVIMDETYHAVFAHADVTTYGKQESLEVIDLSEQGYSNGQEVTTLKQGDVTVTFAKGTASTNTPKYYNTGNAVRCYGGNTMTVAGENITKIEITFGSGESNNEITASPGSFNGSTWTGEADQVVFTVGGSSGHRRIAELKVTRNGETIIVDYTNFLIYCGTATEVENTGAGAPAASKFLHNGQLYIQIGDNTYTITGQRIRQ